MNKLGGFVACLMWIIGYLTVAEAADIQSATQPVNIDSAKTADWKSKWERHILNEVRNGYCGKETGEEIGWLISPLLNGFYWGYLATGEIKWVQQLVACADAWVRRASSEPDGYPGWPKVGAAGTPVDGLDDFYADSLLGEAMALRPIVLMAHQIMTEPALKQSFGANADAYLKLSRLIFEKWDHRGAWRDAESGGKISVVLPFGIDRSTGQWTTGYMTRDAPGNGFSHPNNKANLVASWLLSMFDATGESTYKEIAEKWFELMKSRLRVGSDGTFEIWNYWQPAGPWDYIHKAPKHWIGVHSNSGYYNLDVQGIVLAYQHHLVFDDRDIHRLIATALAQKRYWTALVPYSDAVRENFESTLEADSWPGLTLTPWYLSLQRQRP
jgi:hypothetical protein